jgi:thiamine biosynthesis lipoprotein
MFISTIMPRFALRPLVTHLIAIGGISILVCMPNIAMAQSAVEMSAEQQHFNNIHQDTLHENALYQDHFHLDHVLGTSLDMLAIGATSVQTQRAFLAAMMEINRLDRVLSTYRSDSEISTLNQTTNEGKPITVSKDLFAVIQACETWREHTCGAFSGRMGQVIQAHQNDTMNVDVQAKSISQTLAQQAHHAHVVVDRTTHTITRPQAVQFATDAYAKGYIIDRAMSAALQTVPELTGLMVDMGGDIKVWGQAPRASGWKIGLRDAGQRADNLAPTQALQLKQDSAVAFSGQGARDIVRGTTTHSHLISPQTGQALNHVEHSIVVAPHAADADALATALTAMTPAEGIALIAQLEKTEAQVTLTNGDSFSSGGWNDLVATEQDYGTMMAVNSTGIDTHSNAWPADYTAILDYTIPKPASSEYHAPYVVIWVTDSSRKLVRTLHVFGPQAKWLDSNYIWWKRYGRMTDHLDTIAQPSRAPGHYTVSWDGKDDAGQRVAQGKYTLHIEATREHGGHSYSSFDINAAPQSNTQNLPAKDELGDLKFRFDRVI